MAAGELIESIPQFIVFRHEFPDYRELEQITALGELAIANPFIAATAIEPYREASEFGNERLLNRRVATIEDPIGAAFLIVSANTFNRRLDTRIRFDEGTIRATGAAISKIQKETERVEDDERRILRLQMFLKCCVGWSRQNTPHSSLIIPGQRHEMAPGGEVVLR